MPENSNKMNKQTILKPRLWTASFIKICLVNFFIFVNFHALLPTFPFFVTHLGGDAVAIGIATALFSLASIIARPFVGWLIDTRGRLTILLIGLIGMALIPFGYFFSVGIAWAIFFRTLHGIFHATSSNASNTWVADILPPKRMGEGLGMYGLSMAISTALAPAMGLMLMNILGFRPLFMTASGASFIALIISITISNRQYKLSNEPLQWNRLFERMSLPASVTQFLFMIVYGVVEVYVAFYADRHNLPSGGIYFILVAVATVLTRFILGHTVDRRGEAILVYTGNAAIVLGTILLVLTPNVPSFILSALLLGYSFGAVQPSLQTMALHSVSPDRRGAANSTFFVAFDLGIAIGGFLAGFLAKNFGYDTMFLIISLFGIASTIYYYKFGRRHPSSLNPTMRSSQYLHNPIIKQTNTPLVITISREYGAGGHHIGELLAKRFNFKLYERNFISLTAKESGLSEQQVEWSDQTVDTRSPMLYDDPMQTTVFKTQSRIIQNLASTEPCIIVGRLANFVLRGRKNTLHIFLYAHPTYRAQHAAQTYNKTIEETTAAIERSDKERALHCLRYTGHQWGNRQYYDLLIDTTHLGDERTADIIADMINSLIKQNSATK